MDEFDCAETPNVYCEEGSDMKLAGRLVSARRAWIPAATLLLALSLVLPGTPVAMAGVGDLVNVTLQVPATVYDNPCADEPVALHGDIHILVGTRTDQGGHVHYLSTWNASYSGNGLISGTPYTASERKQESWTASELPASHTATSVVKLISKGAAPNAFLYTTMTTTIDANGVPTANIDAVSVKCRG
jgi:hypothetical protein